MERCLSCTRDTLIGMILCIYEFVHEAMPATLCWVATWSRYSFQYLMIIGPTETLIVDSQLSIVNGAVLIWLPIVERSVVPYRYTS